MNNNDIMVNHPPHYQSRSGIEVIDVVEAFTDGLNGIEAMDTGNIIKYACRWKQKGGIQDLKKLVWYANHLIKHLEGTAKEKEQDELKVKLEQAQCMLRTNEAIRQVTEGFKGPAPSGVPIPWEAD